MGINIKSISSFVNKIGVKSILETRPSTISSINFNKLELASKGCAEKTIGKHLVPKNLYHLTTKQNYKSMLEDGILDVGGEQDFIQGIFMFDLVNFFKRWAPSKANGAIDKRKILLKYVSGYGDDLVLLKIPTKELEKKNLLVRSVDRASSLERRKEFVEIEKNWKKTGVSPKNEFKHLIEGDAAKNSKFYKKRKEAIAFIYPDEIDMSKVEKIGTIRPYQDLLINEMNTGENFLLKAFKEALKGKPEEKAMVVLENSFK